MNSVATLAHETSPQPPSTRARLDEAVTNHYREILAFAYRQAGPASAEDIAQEAFMRLARDLRRLPPDLNVRAWLYRVALNCCRDDYRKRSREAFLPDEVAATNGEPLDLAHQRGLMGDVHVFLQELPPRQRAAFVLRRLQGMTYEEVSTTMGCSADSARANVYQAVKKLRTRFAGEVEL
ncbi:MAG: sigma-70 family RNA polymerase sigma factor [Dehalococcoidia bacterium]|nr:sigma-70 family RNA polymerase sigma factor [Dehalococcoidia bacterium]